MKSNFLASLLLLASIGASGNVAQAVGLLSPTDAIVGIDTDPAHSESSIPGPDESPSKIVDGTLAKYLNFGDANSGFIVTPAVGSTTIKSFQITTANDASSRDPISFEIYGTNSPILSTDQSTGTGEVWTPIDNFDLAGIYALPTTRNTLGPVVPLEFNDVAYTSYKMIFPTLRTLPNCCMQIAEVSFFPNVDGTGGDVLNVGDTVLAIDRDVVPDSGYPAAESPQKAIDGLTNTKYLNFGKENSGFIVTPSIGPSAVRAFQITTADNAEEEARDPVGWALYGTDDPITSAPNSQGNSEAWLLVDSGAMDLPLLRGEAGDFVQVDNDTIYKSYRMLFTSLRDTNDPVTDSVQIGEIQFFDTHVPEPSAALLGVIALMLGSTVAQRSRK